MSVGDKGGREIESPRIAASFKRCIVFRHDRRWAAMGGVEIEVEPVAG